MSVCLASSHFHPLEIDLETRIRHCRREVGFQYHPGLIVEAYALEACTTGTNEKVTSLLQQPSMLNS
eukprot:m.1531058 g.1531058  ORF g.1531058 m.1531058 type:complete len:67 (-) comp25240_c0_seq48:1970-2170(-)